MMRRTRALAVLAVLVALAACRAREPPHSSRVGPAEAVDAGAKLDDVFVRAQDVRTWKRVDASPVHFRMPMPKTAKRRPVVVLAEGHPWGRRGAPLFSSRWTVVVYEDGTVIGEGGHVATTITPAGAASLARDVAAKLDTPEKRPKNGFTDQPEIFMLARDGDAWTGDTFENFDRDGLTNAAPDQRASFSSAFQDATRRVFALAPPGTPAWTNDRLEVSLAEFDYAARSMPWPKDVVPPPPRDLKRLEGTMVFPFVVDGKYTSALREWVKTREPNVAVEANGHKWSLGARVLVPDDDVIERAWHEYVASRD